MKQAFALVLLALAFVAGIYVAPVAFAADSSAKTTDAPPRYEASCEFVRARPVGGYIQVCRLKDTVSGLCYLTVGDAGATPVKCE